MLSPIGSISNNTLGIAKQVEQVAARIGEDNDETSARSGALFHTHGPGGNSLNVVPSTVEPAAEDALGDPKDLSLEELAKESEQAQTKIDSIDVFDPSYEFYQQQATQLDDELERRSLDILETYLVEEEADKDNVLSTGDLYDLANDGTASDEVQIAAQYFLNDKARLDKLDVADHDGGSPDGKIGLGDIHARQLEINEDLTNVDAPLNEGDGRYELPDGDRNVTNLESPQRDQAIFDDQQNAIEESFRTGEEVEFVNSNGETVPVSVESSSDGTAGNYTVHVGENSFDVESEITTADTIAGISNIVDFGSTLDVPEGIRQFPDSVRFLKEANTREGKNDDGKDVTYYTSASYNGDHRLTFYDGAQNIQNPELYYHEIAHGIGRDLDDNSIWFTNDASPAGWPEIHRQAHEENSQLSNYAEENDRESFAEAFAAYVNARNHGEDALTEFREQFPTEANYIDENIFGLTNAPS